MCRAHLALLVILALSAAWAAYLAILLPVGRLGTAPELVTTLLVGALLADATFRAAAAWAGPTCPQPQP